MSVDGAAAGPRQTDFPDEARAAREGRACLAFHKLVPGLVDGSLRL